MCAFLVKDIGLYFTWDDVGDGMKNNRQYRVCNRIGKAIRDVLWWWQAFSTDCRAFATSSNVLKDSSRVRNFVCRPLCKTCTSLGICVNERYGGQGLHLLIGVMFSLI